ncbi:MAG: MlaD family protein [Bacteroidetes bacterium]|nr:MlaD family protein [Bacteroidota bacterium]
MHLKISREIKVALFAAATLALTIWGFYFLKGQDIFKPGRTLYVVFPHAGYIEPSTPVVVNGYKIGIVSDTRLMDAVQGTVLVELQITEDDLFLDKQSEAIISSPGLIAANVIDIKLGTSGQEVVDGDTLRAGVSLGIEATMMNIVEPLQKNMNSVLIDLDSVLVPMKSSLPATVDNLNRLITDVDNLVKTNTGKVASILGNAEKIMATLARNERQLDSMIGNLNRFSDTLASVELAKTVATTQQAMAEVKTLLEGINQGEGTLGQLVKSDAMHQRLDSTAMSLQQLMTEINEHPERFLHFSLIHINKNKDKSIK